MGRSKLEVAKSVQKTIVSGYTRQRKPLGLLALADKVTLSIPVIRRVLVENKVTIRDRGRPKLAKKAKKTVKK